jgi:hypothetical protein
MVTNTKLVFLKTVKNHDTEDNPLTQQPFDRQECLLHP